MPWVMVFVGLAFAGLVVLGACAIKVYAAVRGLAREIERTRRRLEPGDAALRREMDRLDRTPE